MPIREREKLSGFVRMRVINPKAERDGETGWVVGLLGDEETPLDLDVFELQFEEDGRRYRYNIVELEVVMV